MKRLLLTAVATVALATAMLMTGVAPASAADVTINAAGCGGHVTVPAGSTITVRSSDGEVTRGMLTDWLQAQTTTLTVNGGAPIDVSSLYSAPIQRPGGGWFSFFTYPTGITLANPGDSMTFTVTATLSHLFAEVFNGPLAFELGFEPGPPTFSGPGIYATGTCTVTAV